MGGLSKLVTFRGLVQLMQRFNYHEVYPNPAAYYQHPITGLSKKKTTSTDISQDPKTASFWQNMEAVERSRAALENMLNQTLPVGQGDPGREMEQALNFMNKTLCKAEHSLPTVPGLNLLKDVTDMDAALKDVRAQLCITTGNGLAIDPNRIGDPR